MGILHFIANTTLHHKYASVIYALLIIGVASSQLVQYIPSSSTGSKSPTSISGDPNLAPGYVGPTATSTPHFSAPVVYVPYQFGSGSKTATLTSQNSSSGNVDAQAKTVADTAPQTNTQSSTPASTSSDTQTAQNSDPTSTLPTNPAGNNTTSTPLECSQYQIQSQPLTSQIATVQAELADVNQTAAQDTDTNYGRGGQMYQNTVNSLTQSYQTTLNTLNMELSNLHSQFPGC